jgi:hypothetical protein
MKKFILMVLAVTALTSCSKFEQVPDGNNENGSPIELSGVISTGAETRGVIDGTPEGGLEFDLFRANETSSFGNYMSAFDAKLGKDKKITVTPTQYYLPDVSKRSSFIGLYPKGGTLGTNTVTYPELDGDTDILGSKPVLGSQNTTKEKTLSLQFAHLLTKIRVEVYVEGTDADDILNISRNFGAVTGITVAGKKVAPKVTFPAADAIDAVPTVTTDDTSGDALPLTKTNGNVTLTGATKEFGHVMFVPVTTDEALALTVYTENNTAGFSVKDIEERKWEAGKAYLITVKFTKDNKVYFVEVKFDNSVINDWGTETSTPGSI